MDIFLFINPTYRLFKIKGEDSERSGLVYLGENPDVQVVVDKEYAKERMRILQEEYPEVAYTLVKFTNPIERLTKEPKKKVLAYMH